MKGLDNWITGNYGEDHPDNQRCADCDHYDCRCDEHEEEEDNA